jgi:DNA repair exonuclease SbcCD ATPase subunit
MSEKQNKNVSDEIDSVIKEIEKDVKIHKELLEEISANANRILEMLEVQDENIEEIKESQEHWRNIADNTKMIASAISTYADQNARLIDAVAGKQQVPVSVFMMVVGMVCVIGLSVLVIFGGIDLKVQDVEIRKGNTNAASEN